MQKILVSPPVAFRVVGVVERDTISRNELALEELTYFVKIMKALYLDPVANRTAIQNFVSKQVPLLCRIV